MRCHMGWWGFQDLSLASSWVENLLAVLRGRGARIEARQSGPGDASQGPLGP